MTRAANPCEDYTSVPPAPLEPAAAPAASRYRYTARRYFSAPRSLLLPAITLLIATTALFFWTIARMWERWHVSTGYYSHGPLVLPISLVAAWIIIRRNGLPMHSTRSSRVIALVVLVGSLLIHLASMYARVIFVSGFMMLPILAAFVLYLGGWPMLRRLWFPIAFLAFMVPLPDLTIYNINFHLKIFAAQASTAAVNAVGIPAYLKGSDIFLQGGKQLTVEDACSGLRSLISLVAFATLFTYACRLRGYKRLLLLLSAVPIAVAANVVRIAVLTIVANDYSVALATPGGWAHDMMGFVVFVIAFCIMFTLESLLDLLPGAASRGYLGGKRGGTGPSVGGA
ncbi:MAG: exosortase/archaeosortase family protein [Phycisphaerae bacterium]